MRQPEYVVEFPAGMSEQEWEEFEALVDLLREDRTNERLIRMIEARGGTVRRVKHQFPKPRPAIVRRALALHR